MGQQVCRHSRLQLKVGQKMSVFKNEALLSIPKTKGDRTVKRPFDRIYKRNKAIRFSDNLTTQNREISNIAN